MHELTPCPEGPKNKVELGLRFPNALSEELADNPDSKLANQLATRLQENTSVTRITGAKKSSGARRSAEADS